jgi:erythromycin esterase-like protein
MGRNTIYLFISFCICFCVHAQEFTPKMIALSGNPRVEDFTFLKEELKDVQIVLLGESSHYDGNVFEMKTKIVAFLYREMGFTTIAFESGIYDVWNAQKAIENGLPVKESLMKSLFSIWSKSNEFQSFISFYDQNKRDLQLFGFDYQITGDDNFHALSKDLFGYADKIKFKHKLQREDFELLLESITVSGMFDEEDISYAAFDSFLSQLKNSIAKEKDSEEKFYWTQIVQSIHGLGNAAITDRDVLSTFIVSASDNSRDKQMAENLLAYIKRNPEAKIICWGANAHFVNTMRSVQEPILGDFIPMGSFIKTALQKKVYSLSCVTANDSIYLQNKWHKTPIAQNSFEYYLQKNKAPHVFISSHQTGMNHMILNRFFSPITFVEGNLSTLHDGYLFFKNTTQSTTVEHEALAVSHKKYIPATGLEEVNPEGTNLLEEVIIYGKRKPFTIMQQVIDSLPLNYPSRSFSSKLKTNVTATVSNRPVLDFDFVADQYDLSYVAHTNRSLKSLQEIRWTIHEDFQPESLREYHGLIYNSPIQYAPFLKKGKFKKFHFILEEIKTYNNEAVYVISFTSPRKHSSFTRRVYLSNYSGYLYVNRKDFAVVKIFENWEVTDFPESFRQGYNFKNSLSAYTGKEYINESTTTDFIKIGATYFISHSDNTITGTIYTPQDNRENFMLTVDSFWTDFSIQNPKKIKNNSEEHLFKNVKYNPVFWESK